MNNNYDIKQHNFIIRQTQGSHKFGRIIAFDTEANRKQIDDDTEIQTLHNYSLYDGEQYYTGNSYMELINHIWHLKNKYKQISIIAHNIKYDLQLSGLNKDILYHKKLWDLPVKSLIIDNLFYSKLSKQRYFIEFIDSMNYFRAPLSSLAKSFGITKYATIEDYSLQPDKWNKYIDVNGEELCNKDVKILYTIFDKFLSMGFSNGITSAQTSFNTFRKDFLQFNITLNADYVLPALESYRGGIVNVFKYCHNKLLYSYDINSLYPYVMKKYKYSVKFHKQVNPDEYKYLKYNIDSSAYNYLINASVRNVERNPVPISYDGKLIFFSSFNDKWITGREYAELINSNADVRVNTAYEFINADLFSGFVDYYYSKKQHSEESMRDFYKIILNSLYGKFGQHMAHSEVISLEEPEKFEKYFSPEDTNMLYDLLEHRIIDSSRIKFQNRYLSLYSGYVSIMDTPVPKNNPLIASEITANARLLNYEYRKKMGFDHVYYTDTDSFFTDVELRDKSILNNKLGNLKNDKTGYFTINANKDYYYIPVTNAPEYMMYMQYADNSLDANKYKFTLKGIPKRAINTNIKINDIDVVYENNFVLYRFSSLKSKDNYGKVIVKKENKTLLRLNTKMEYNDGSGKQWGSEEEYDKGIYKKIIV
jgi:hypothetical protein